MPADLIDNNNENDLTSSNCERCGKDFFCGVKDGHCWCFDVKLSPRTLVKIAKNYERCVCPACLIEAECDSLPPLNNP